MDVDQPVVVLGPLLTMDPKKERFIGNEDADQLLRDARDLFVIPNIGA